MKSKARRGRHRQNHLRRRRPPVFRAYVSHGRLRRVIYEICVSYDNKTLRARLSFFSETDLDRFSRLPGSIRARIRADRLYGHTYYYRTAKERCTADKYTTAILRTRCTRVLLSDDNIIVRVSGLIVFNFCAAACHRNRRTEIR